MQQATSERASLRDVLHMSSSQTSEKGWQQPKKTPIVDRYKQAEPMRKPMTTVDAKDYIDAKADQTRAQNDARFAEVLAELRIIHEKLNSVPTTRSMLLNTLAAVVGTVGLGLGVMAYAGDRFDSGIASYSLVSELLKKQEARDLAQDAKFDEVIRVLNAISTKSSKIDP